MLFVLVILFVVHIGALYSHAAGIAKKGSYLPSPPGGARCGCSARVEGVVEGLVTPSFLVCRRPFSRSNQGRGEGREGRKERSYRTAGAEG